MNRAHVLPTFLIHPHKQTRRPTQTLSLCHTHTLSRGWTEQTASVATLYLWFFYTRIDTQTVSPSLSHTHRQPHRQTHRLSVCLSLSLPLHTHTPTESQVDRTNRICCDSLYLSVSLSLTHRHTHTHTHTHTLPLSLTHTESRVD